jgi:hypothetical protein
VSKKTKMMKNLWFCILSSTVSDLAAHLVKFNGTPVEKHCNVALRGPQKSFLNELAQKSRMKLRTNYLFESLFTMPAIC